MTPRYPITVFWSEQDKIWVADVPDLKSCSAFGDTPESAVAELNAALEAWLQSAAASGHPLPKPSSVRQLFAAE
jgi:predicted RNase H-like HicB family nuclease